MFGVSKMKSRFSAVVFILLVSGIPARAEQPDQGIPILGVSTWDGKTVLT
jgi:hypothetical protein